MCPYISYTVHFIDDNWILRNRCQFLPQDHTGERLSKQMWELHEEKQVCLTTDSGSNMISAAASLDWIRLSCFGHNLHLAITKSLKDDNRCSHAIGLCRKIVSAFSTSWKRRLDLRKVQKNLELKEQSLVQHGGVQLEKCYIGF